LKQQEAERQLPMQLLLILLNSIGAAVVVSMLAALALRYPSPGNPLTDPEASRFVLFLSFALGFFLALLLLVRRLPANWWKLAEEIANTPKLSVPGAKWGGVLDAGARSQYAPLFDTKATTKAPAAPPTLGLDRTEGEDAFAASPEPAANHPEATPDAAPPKPLPPSDPATAEAAAAEARRAAAEHLDTFIAATTAAIAAAGKALDALGKFALQLVLAGGCSALARKFMLTAAESFGLLVQGQVKTGTAKVFAESFAANAEHYAQRPAYRPLIDQGQEAMDGQLMGDAPAGAAVGTAIAAWANDENAKLAPKIVTFLVTDIVDASGLAQRLGNLQARRVVRAHQQAVRSGIEKCGGTEVRNSGDGALATFPDPEKAVAAAKIALQRIAQHNAGQPHLSANVRAAVHAGEAITDDDGYFGATVVAAAKICQSARAGQILVSDLVKAFCKSGAASFTENGALEDSLLGRPRPLFEVSWSATAVEYGELGKSKS
jgi:class 3 adenylate cyclase